MPVGLSEKFLKVLRSVARDAQGQNFASIEREQQPGLSSDSECVELGASKDFLIVDMLQQGMWHSPRPSPPSVGTPQRTSTRPSTDVTWCKEIWANYNRKSIHNKSTEGDCLIKKKTNDISSDML
ncbi:Mediator Of Rna polymerase Ii Transcription Subunit 17 [Manis pentadactyla]|nr:Mediator Of Rna polymerase Ii Transcription Subunit 17 [Manis pentadactyla]